MKKANNIMGKMDYFSSIDKLAGDFAPKGKTPLSVGNYDYIGAFTPPTKKKYNPYKQEMNFLPPKKRFDPYENSWGRQVQQTLHVGPAQSKELNKKQMTELIHELKEKKFRAKKAAEDAREIQKLSKKYMNTPWSAVPARYRKKYGNMDFDRDGVPNKNDCYPFDYDRQLSFFGINVPGTGSWGGSYFAPAPKPAPTPAPKVNISVPSTGSAKDVVWAGNIAAAVAQASTQPKTPAGTAAGNATIAGAISGAQKAGANVTVGSTPVSGITTIGGVPITTYTGGGSGGSPVGITGTKPGDSTGGDIPYIDPTPKDKTSEELTVESFLFKYDSSYDGKVIDEAKKDQLYRDILEGKINDPSFKTALEALIGPARVDYLRNQYLIAKEFGAQAKVISSMAQRKSGELERLGGASVANKYAVARAEQILKEKTEALQSAKEAKLQSALEKFYEKKTELAQPLNKSAEAAALEETIKKAGEYTTDKIMTEKVSIPIPKGTKISELSDATLAQYRALHRDK